MGDGLRVLFGAFCGHAVESSLFIGSASARCSGGGAWHPFGCSTLPSVWYQSKDWFQVVGSFSIARGPWAVGSFAASPPLARTDCQSLAQGDRPDTAAPSALGRKEDLCPSAQKASARPPAQGANHSQMVEAAGIYRPPSCQRTSGTPTGATSIDGPKQTQSRLDRRFQRLVLHAGRATGGPIDSARSVQPLSVGHPIASP